MKHRVWLDEAKQILWVRFVGYCNASNVNELCDRCQDFLKDHASRKVVIDLSEIESFPDEELCSQLVGQLRRAGVERVALVCSRPEAKMVGIILMEYLGRYADAQFFSQKHVALEWLEHSTGVGGGEMCGEVI
ncbi:hypothetical protein ES703_41028 [subsurface metagenome]